MFSNQIVCIILSTLSAVINHVGDWSLYIYIDRYALNAIGIVN